MCFHYNNIRVITSELHVLLVKTEQLLCTVQRHLLLSRIITLPSRYITSPSVSNPVWCPRTPLYTLLYTYTTKKYTFTSSLQMHAHKPQNKQLNHLNRKLKIDCSPSIFRKLSYVKYYCHYIERNQSQTHHRRKPPPSQTLTARHAFGRACVRVNQVILIMANCSRVCPRGI